MKTKNLRLIILLIVSNLISQFLTVQSVKAVEYGATITVDVPREVDISELKSNAVPSSTPSIESNIRIKNGQRIVINLGSLATLQSITDLYGCNLVGNGRKIEVSEAGRSSFTYYLQTSGGNQGYRVLIDINYYGTLQYAGADAPATLDVTTANENEQLSVPGGKFGAMWWFGNGTEEVSTAQSISLNDLLATGYTSFVAEFNDGTSNQLADGSAGALSSCAITLVDKRTPPPTLSVSPTSLAFIAGGEGKQITVTSNQSWSVSSNQTWLTLSASAGTNNGSITATATANTATTSRTATITFTAGSLTQTVTVTQAGATPPPPTPPTPQPKRHKVNFSKTGEGNLKVSVDGTPISSEDLVEEGKVVKLTTSPASGWETKNIKITTASSKEIAISKDSSFTMPNEAVAVSIEFGTVSNEHIPGFEAYASGEIVYLSLPAKETVRIYSLTGVLVGVYPLSEGAHQLLPSQKGILIINGSTGWSRKVILR